jgi:hypothetical protein
MGAGGAVLSPAAAGAATLCACCSRRSKVSPTLRGQNQGTVIAKNSSNSEIHPLVIFDL